jgi:predicted solute-binding protein
MLNAGAQLATASQITADSPATRAIVNANLGYPQQSVAIFSITANTVAAASVVWLRTLGVPLFTGNTPMARNNYWQLTEYYDGELIVGPGTALVVGGNTGAGTYDIALVWEEVPV